MSTSTTPDWTGEQLVVDENVPIPLDEPLPEEVIIAFLDAPPLTTGDGALTAGGPGSGRYPKGSGAANRVPSTGPLPPPSPGAAVIKNGVLSSQNARAYFSSRFTANGPSSKQQAQKAVGDRMTDCTEADLTESHVADLYDSSREYGYAKANGLDVRLGSYNGKLSAVDNGDVSLPGDAKAGSPEGLALLRQGVAAEAISAWAATSKTPLYQEAAREEFKINKAAPSASFNDYFGDNSDPAWQPWNAQPPAVKKVARSFVRSSAAATQAQLQADGIKTIEVFRGTTQGLQRGTQRVPLRPLSSFSTSKDQAQSFAGGYSSAILHDRVPVSAVMGMPGTGQGCLSEQEIVLRGGQFKMDYDFYAATMIDFDADIVDLPGEQVPTADVDLDALEGDWIKTLGWDLPTDPAAFTPEELQYLSTLPAWEAAPPEIKAALPTSPTPPAPPAPPALTAGGPGSGRYPKGSGAASAPTPSAGAKFITNGMLSKDNSQAYFVARYGGRGADPLVNQAAKVSAANAVADNLDLSPAEMTSPDAAEVFTSVKAYNTALTEGKRIRVTYDGALEITDATGGSGPSATIEPGSPEGVNALKHALAAEHITGWAQTSGLPLYQGAARDEFKIPGSADWAPADPDYKGAWADYDKQPAGAKTVARGLLRASAKASQAQLMADGVKSIEVYRGTLQDFPTGKVRTKLRPLTSFSTDPGTAQGFHTGSLDPDPSAPILKDTIPVSAVVGTPGTGSGCLREYEFVTKGGEFDMDYGLASNFAVAVAAGASAPVLLDDAEGDWIKTLAWDLPTTPESFTPEELQLLSTLPAWEAAPPQIKEALQTPSALTAGGPGSGRYPKGSGKANAPAQEFPPLTRDQFSDPTTPRTRPVSNAEFQALAIKGESRLATFHDNGSPPTGLDKNWTSIKDQGWAAVQDEWGGITVDSHTGELVSGNPNKYALTVRPAGVSSVRIPVGSDQATFDKAMEESRQRFDSVLGNEHYHLGVFRDDAISSIDIDPVMVLDDHDDVESIGAYAHSEGGAYNFADGLGYWPPYVDEGLDNGGQQRQAVQGPRRVVQQAENRRGPP